MTVATNFLGQAEARSQEHRDAFNLLFAAKLYGVCVGLLRQELDTLIRLCYLWRLDTSNAEAVRLMQLSIDGSDWKITNAKGKIVRVRDREMVELATHLGGWEKVIYEFGCKLIHLSDAHLYRTQDPLRILTDADRMAIVGYLRSYHSYPGQSVSFHDLIDYLPKVFEKLAGNVSFYVEELRARYGNA